jgi:hypothetical protein
MAFATAVLDDALAPVGSDVGEVYEKVLDELGRCGARLEYGYLDVVSK